MPELVAQRRAQIGIHGGRERFGSIQQALHSDLLRTSLFADFARLFPERFTNVTNGVTPRRWLALANPSLNSLLTDRLGVAWPGRPDALAALEPLASDRGFRQQWAACKHGCMQRRAQIIHQQSELLVDPDSLFDVQVIAQDLRIKNGDAAGPVPCTVIFGGKAAPGYAMAKLIIRFINGIAAVGECRSRHLRIAAGGVPGGLQRQAR